MGDPRKIEELGRLLREAQAARRAAEEALRASRSSHEVYSASLDLALAGKAEQGIMLALRKTGPAIGAQVPQRHVVIGGLPAPPRAHEPVIRSQMGAPTQLPEPQAGVSRILPDVGGRFEITPEIERQVEGVMQARHKALQMAGESSALGARIGAIEAGRQYLISIGMSPSEAARRAQRGARRLVGRWYERGLLGFGFARAPVPAPPIPLPPAPIPIGEEYADALARALPGEAGAGVMGETVFGILGGTARVLWGLPASSRPLNEVVEAINAGRWEKSGGKLYIW